MIQILFSKRRTRYTILNSISSHVQFHWSHNILFIYLFYLKDFQHITYCLRFPVSKANEVPISSYIWVKFLDDIQTPLKPLKNIGKN